MINSNGYLRRSWCPVDFVLHILGTRWTTAIINELRTGPKRPSELSKALPKISAKTLTQRLRDLETSGFLNRESYEEIPPRVVYSLTNRGRDLVFLLEAINDYGESWQLSGAFTELSECTGFSEQPDTQSEIEMEESREQSAQVSADILAHRSNSIHQSRDTLHIVPTAEFCSVEFGNDGAQDSDDEDEDGNSFFTFVPGDYRKSLYKQLKRQC
jgi:DNA-binding HxlR family transcriptional regulator